MCWALKNSKIDSTLVLKELNVKWRKQRSYNQDTTIAEGGVCICRLSYVLDSSTFKKNKLEEEPLHAYKTKTKQ